MTEEEGDSLHRCRIEIHENYKMEEIMWYQRARSKWLMEGDTNTTYFHRVVNIRHRMKAIHSLCTSEGDLVSRGELNRHIYEHFRELFGRAKNRRIRLLKDMWPLQSNLLELEKEFSEEEIKKAIWNLGQDKALGPDGFSIFFIHIFWSTLKDDRFSLF